VSRQANASNDEKGLTTAEDASIQAIVRRMQQRRRDQRAFAGFLVLMTLVMSIAYGYFRHIDLTSVAVDLRLAADAAAPAGQKILVYAEVVDAQTGQPNDAVTAQLEFWDGDTLVQQWPVHGARYEAILMPKAGAELRLTREMEGPAQSEARLRVAAGPAASWRDTRGGMYAPVGEPGLRPVRSERACGWTIDAVPYGGVPVANLPTPTLIHVRDAQGNGVETTLRFEGGGSVRARTDAEGFAEVPVLFNELGYWVIHADCAAGDQYVGFEVQPVFDGLMITHFEQSDGGVRAEVADVAQRSDARYDLRCEGVLYAHGLVSSDGALPLSKEHLAGVPTGAACLLQVYRGRFSKSASRTARVFRLGESALAWDWARQSAGVGRQGLELHARSMDRDAEAIAAWKRSGYRNVRVGIATALALSLLLWFAFVMWGSRRRRARMDVRDDMEMEDSHATVSYATGSTGVQSLLWSGWIAMIVAYGGLYVVLMLMGL